MRTRPGRAIQNKRRPFQREWSQQKWSSHEACAESGSSSKASPPPKRGRHSLPAWPHPKGGCAPGPIFHKIAVDMKPPRFEYHAPSSVGEALELLAEFGPEAKVISGGQSLMPILNMRLISIGHLIDINRISELETLQAQDDSICVGASVRQRVVERSANVAEYCPVLTEALNYVGHPVIRNRGTLVGSAVHADPAAEIPAVLLLLGGTVTAASSTGDRQIRSDDFFRGPFETDLRSDELATEVRFGASDGRMGSAFMEVARRHGDFAICGVGAVVGGEAARVAFTGVGPVPEVVDVTDPLGESIDAAIEQAVRHLDPADDIHASAAYRRHLARVLGTRALMAALDRAGRRGDRGGAHREPRAGEA
jgi:aerobic carbon-monoxide dehydrogenase medium subunit